jgi:hypothetical protein
MADNIAEGQLAADAGLTLETLRRDLGGHLPGTATGEKQRGRMVGRLILGDDRLMLCFDGPPVNGVADWTKRDDVVVYEVASEKLVRTDNSGNEPFVVADGVERLRIADLGSGIRLELTLRRRDLSRTYTLVTQDS